MPTHERLRVFAYGDIEVGLAVDYLRNEKHTYDAILVIELAIEEGSARRTRFLISDIRSRLASVGPGEIAEAFGEFGTGHRPMSRSLEVNIGTIAGEKERPGIPRVRRRAEADARKPCARK